jgi:hypothetical protein
LEVPNLSDKKEIDLLREKINDIKRRLPAHSVKPAMLQELEQLEDRLEELKKAD